MIFTQRHCITTHIEQEYSKKTWLIGTDLSLKLRIFVWQDNEWTRQYVALWWPTESIAVPWGFGMVWRKDSCAYV